MYKVTFDDEAYCDILYGRTGEWKSYISPDFDEEVVIYSADRQYSPITEASWWKNIMAVIETTRYYDLDDPNYDTYYEGRIPLTDEQKEKIGKLMSQYNDDEDIELLIGISKIIQPNIELETGTIRGSSQSDWADVVAIKDKINFQTFADIFFGNVSEVHIECDDIDYWDFITDTELWDMERNGDFKQNVRDRWDIPADQELKVYKRNGTTHTPNYDEI